MSGPYGQCRYCGSQIARPITEMFWCHDGCRRAWEVEAAKVKLEMAAHAPRVPVPGFPVLGADGARQGLGGWGHTSFPERRRG